MTYSGQSGGGSWNRATDEKENIIPWYIEIAKTTEPIFQNVAQMATKDSEQRGVSKDAARLQIMMNIGQALGLMEYDVFDTKEEMDALPKDEHERIKKRNKFFIIDDEKFKKRSLPFLYALQAKLQHDAGIAATMFTEYKSRFSEMQAYKKEKGLV